MKQFDETTSRNIWCNLPTCERRALLDLAQDPTVIIKEADKGGAIVLQDVEDYCYEVFRQLEDRKTYLPIPNDPTSHIMNIIKVTVTEAEVAGYISHQIASFLVNPFPRVPVFYILPKIHKSGTPPPGRPIVH